MGDATATPIRDIAPPRWLASQLASALEAATRGDALKHAVLRRLGDVSSRLDREEDRGVAVLVVARGDKNAEALEGCVRDGAVFLQHGAQLVPGGLDLRARGASVGLLQETTQAAAEVGAHQAFAGFGLEDHAQRLLDARQAFGARQAAVLRQHRPGQAEADVARGQAVVVHAVLLTRGCCGAGKSR